MIDQDDNKAPAKPRRGIPAAVRPKLKEAIKAHLKEHGRRRNRHLLREHPELSAWIGYHVGNNGETGDKRLDRAFDEVQEELAAASRRSRLGTAVPSTAAVTPPAEREGGATPARVLGGSRSAVLGHEELERLAAQCLPELDAAMAACRDETGLADIDGYVKLSRERRATLETVADLSQRFQTQRNSNAFLKALWERIAHEFRHEPERGRVFFEDVNKLAAAQGGLPLTSGGSLEE